MSNDHDHSPQAASSTTTASTANADSDPGRSSTSALLRKPNIALVSGLLSRKARDANGVAEGADSAVAAAGSSSGSPLPATLQRKFEGSLGADLSGVRVHTGSESAAANDAVGAKAYTMGNDIHFGAGNYDPSSKAGEHLLAHEVAHTVQQSGGVQRQQFKLNVSSPGDSLEHEADRAADAMINGAPSTVTGAAGVARTVMRDAKPAAGPAGPAPKDADPAARVTRVIGRLETSQSLLLGIQKRCNVTLDKLHAELQTILKAHEKAYSLYIAKVNKELAENGKKMKEYAEAVEQQERMKTLAEMSFKVATLGVELLIEEEVPVVGPLVGKLLEKIGEAAIANMEAPAIPTIASPTVNTGLTLFNKAVDGLDRLDKLRHAVIDVGIQNGSVAEAHNGLGHFKDAIVAKKPSSKEDSKLQAQLTAIEELCPLVAKLDSGATTVDHACTEAFRQAQMQAKLADPKKLAEELEAGDSKKDKTDKSSDPYAALGKSAQVVSDLVPWGEVVIESGQKGKPTRFKARVFKDDPSAPAPVLHAGAFRVVIGVDGDMLVLDNQQQVGAKNSDVAVDDKNKGNEKLIGKKVQVVMHLAPIGTVIELETKKSYPAHANIQAGLPSGAIRTVVAVEQSDMLVVEFKAGKDEKDGKGWAQYDGGPNDDLYFHFDAAAPGKPPEKYGYVYGTGAQDNKGVGTLYFVKIGYKLEGSGADLKAVKIPVEE